MDAPWRIQLLGCLRAAQGEWTITRFRSQRTAALLAYLAYFYRRPHPREELIELLWPESDFEAGRNGLRVALSSLRHQLEPPGVPAGAVLVADRMTVQLNSSACLIDVAEFEAALQAARGADGGARAQRLSEAVELYGGALLPGYYDAWMLPERQRLSEAYLQALEQLGALLEEQGDRHAALQVARRAVAADPLREEAHHDLMRLLAANGQPHAALRQYRELERLLAEELDAAPAPEIRHLACELERRRDGTETLPGSGPGRLRPDPAGSSEAATASEQADSLPSRSGIRAGEAEPPESASPAGRRTPPTGTVTFLLTSIERASDRRAEKGGALSQAEQSVSTLLDQMLQQHGGYKLGPGAETLGEKRTEAVVAAFQAAGSALRCALDFRGGLAAVAPEQADGALRVRMALHTGDVDGPAGEYDGPALRCARRVLLAGHGGQILCSQESASLLRRELAPGVQLLDLGVYRLRDVAAPEQLFQVDDPGMGQQEFPPLNASPAYTGHLPIQFTRFFGRETEIGQLRDPLLAGETRLVTLTGLGGSGKTRLALEVAQGLRDTLRGAVWFVSLVDLSDAGLILDKVVDALRLPRSPQADPLEQVVATLLHQPSLLVLDSFEHLVAGGSTLVQTLLERVPTLTILVTSRHRLELASEREYPVYPLPVPVVGSRVWGVGGGPLLTPPPHTPRPIRS